MEQLGEYMKVEERPNDPLHGAYQPKTRRWVIRDRHDGVLGWVKWFGRWRQYCFYPTTDTVFNNGCLRNIIEFLEHANAEHRAGKEAGRGL